MIKDSGSRREFESGAVRDMAEGKGRFDLVPLDIMANHTKSDFIEMVSLFQDTGELDFLYKAIDILTNEFFGNSKWDMYLQLAKHFEEGCKKYGDNNWRKGIPVKFFIDSAVRHYVKKKAGWDDEPHERAAVWNIICAIWTSAHKKKLNEYAKVSDKLTTNEKKTYVPPEMKILYSEENS